MIKAGVWLMLSYCIVACVATEDGVETARCFIKIKSYSLSDCSKPNDGYVYLNGKLVWEGGWFQCSTKPNLRGINTMIVDPFTCTASDIRRFDTYISAGESNDLREYLQWVHDGALIVGVTGDEPSANLGPALSILKAAGVWVGDVKFRGNFAFVMQKGYPQKTHMAKSVTNGVPFSLLEVSVHGVSTEKLQITAIKKYSVIDAK